MEILEAYCVELDKVVDIYEAQKAYFALSKNRRKRFNFRCSDDICREEKNPLVSGVNYDKLIEESDKYRQIHFRAPVGNPHLETCIWMQRDVQCLLNRRNADGDLRSRVKRAKLTNVIDVFRPKVSDMMVGKAFDKQETNSPLCHESMGSNPSLSGGVRAHDGYTSTSCLERFINCWAQYTGDELRRHTVVIEGKKLSYRQAVLRPNWITFGENGHRIVYGGARAKLWPEDMPNRLYINFMDGCEKLGENNDDCSLTINLCLSRVRAYSGGRLLMEKIEQAQSPNYYLQVYFWGTIKTHNKGSGYVVEIDALDNLVLKVIARRSIS